MSRASPILRSVVAQAAMEARLTARRGENLLAMVGVPVVVLLFFGTVGRPGGDGASGPDQVSALLPATLSLAIVASGLVNLGIATAYERGYGVLKRLGGSPLGRFGLVAAKIVVVLAIAMVQVAGLMAVAALMLGWRAGPDASLVALAGTTLVGTAAFAGLGLAIAGAVRPETALVAANVLFLLALVLGGTLTPLVQLPVPLATAAGLLPVGALTEAFGAALGSGAELARPLAIVGAWAITAIVVTVRTFRWD